MLDNLNDEELERLEDFVEGLLEVLGYDTDYGGAGADSSQTLVISTSICYTSNGDS